MADLVMVGIVVGAVLLCAWAVHALDRSARR